MRVISKSGFCEWGEKCGPGKVAVSLDAFSGTARTSPQRVIGADGDSAIRISETNGIFLLAHRKSREGVNPDFSQASLFSLDTPSLRATPLHPKQFI